MTTGFGGYFYDQEQEKWVYKTVDQVLGTEAYDPNVDYSPYKNMHKLPEGNIDWSKAVDVGIVWPCCGNIDCTCQPAIAVSSSAAKGEDKPYKEARLGKFPSLMNEDGRRQKIKDRAVTLCVEAGLASLKVTNCFRVLFKAGYTVSDIASVYGVPYRKVYGAVK